MITPSLPLGRGVGGVGAALGANAAAGFRVAFEFALPVLAMG